MSGRGKTFTAREIVTALSRRGFVVVTAIYHNDKYDTVDTIYVETPMKTVIRIDVTAVPDA